MKFTVTLTQLQQSALVGILVEYLLQPTTTREWIMVTTNEQTTIEELIDLMSHATPINVASMPSVANDEVKGIWQLDDDHKG